MWWPLARAKLLMRPNGLLVELRRRKVFRVAAAYVLVAWALLQAADVIFPRVGLPDWTVTLVIVLLLMGFPLALVLAWAFEITPQGVRGDDAPEPFHRPHRAAWFGLGGALLMVLGFIASSLLLPGGSATSPPPPVRAVAAGAPVPETEAKEEDALYRALLGSRGGASVAVLPFGNLSADTLNAFFTAGIHDAVITALANVADLTVTSRTSVMPYSGATKDVRTIAGELGVSHVVEGTVQRAGGRVRVTVQLIDAGTDRHVWADHFDREVTPDAIFAIQSGIAERVAAALEANLSPRERDQIERRPTDNLEAWELYNRARHLVRTSESPELEAQVVTMLRRAAALDPDFALAYADLARVYLGEWDRSQEARWRDSIHAAVGRALEIDPSLPEAHMALAGYHHAVGDLEGERRLTLRVLELRPNSAEALSRLSRLEADASRLDRSLCLARRAVDVEPTEGSGWIRLGAAYRDLGYFGQAEEAFRAVLDRGDGDEWLYHYLVEVALAQGSRTRALEYYRALRAGAGASPGGLRRMAAVEWQLRRVDSAYAHVRRIEDSGASHPVDLQHAAALWQAGDRRRADRSLNAIEAAARARLESGAQDFFPHLHLMAVHAMRGDAVLAVDALEKAVERGFRILPWIQPRPERAIGGLPGMELLEGHGRYHDIMARLSAAQDSMRQIVARNGC